MKKIDIEKLGETITEYRDGVPYASHIDPMVACREIAEKINELITAVEGLAPTKTDKQ